jgi:peptidoglycan/LPS O-acetylase OafA/YrhL
MQLGYVVYYCLTPSVPLTVAIIAGMTLLSLAVWRYFERPAQRWTRQFLTGQAGRFGWSTKPDTATGTM